MSVPAESSPKRKVVYWTRMRISTVALTVLGCMVQTASYSVLAPFYPSVARAKGNDATQIGIVFSVYAFVGFVSSPFIGKMVSSSRPHDHLDEFEVQGLLASAEKA